MALYTGKNGIAIHPNNPTIIFDKIAPFYTANIRKFTVPNGGATIANSLISRFSVKHILLYDTESVVGMVHQAPL